MARATHVSENERLVRGPADALLEVIQLVRGRGVLGAPLEVDIRDAAPGAFDTVRVIVPHALGVGDDEPVAPAVRIVVGDATRAVQLIGISFSPVDARAIDQILAEEGQEAVGQVPHHLIVLTAAICTCMDEGN